MRQSLLIENVDQKRHDLDHYRSTLKPMQQKRFDKVLNLFDKNLSLLSTYSITDETITPLSKSETVQQEMIAYANQIKTIIRDNSRQTISGYSIGDTVYLNNKPLVIGQILSNETFVPVNSNLKWDNSPILITCVTKHKRDANNNHFYHPSQTTLIDRISQTVITSNLKYFLTQYACKEFNLNPYYQRDFVWTTQQKQAYILALLDEKTVFKPTFIRYSHSKTQQTGYYYEVLDGKQRIDAILSFIRGEFPVNNLYFADFSQIDFDKLMHIPMEFTNIRYYNSVTKNQQDLSNDETLELFLEINSYGTPVDPNHIESIKQQTKSNHETDTSH